MLELSGLSEMRAWSRAQKAHGGRIGFVPTMGYLHEGHLRLVDRAKARADRVVVSIFVNPLQFGQNEDFTTYPRDRARDRALAQERGVDCLFTPETKVMYPADPVTRVIPEAMAGILEGAIRPGHFAGVLTVVAKLFHVVEPDVAIFGRKDYQQATLIRRMVADLDVPVEIEVAPTTRELDGLALSSRNTYLTADERRSALALSRALRAVEQAWRGGGANPEHLQRPGGERAGARPHGRRPGGAGRRDRSRCARRDPLPFPRPRRLGRCGAHVIPRRLLGARTGL